MATQVQRQLPIGTKLRNGDYQIIRMLGQGGFGITYLAKHRVFGEVALKELFLNSGATYCSRESTTGQGVVAHFDEEQFKAFKGRFEAEARTLFSLHKIKGVVKVLDIFDENETSYFSMEYLDGQKLEDYVKSRGALKEEEALRIVGSLGNTLHEIHGHNVLHRDIKPTNIIVGKNGEVTLIDFGIARSYIDEMGETHTTFHSPRYAPPEQKIANEKIGQYSDVYSLGATAYYVFTGTPPQSVDERSLSGVFKNARSIVSLLPEHIDAALTRSLSLKKEDRFQTVKDFLLALRLPVAGNERNTNPNDTLIENNQSGETTLIEPLVGPAPKQGVMPVSPPLFGEETRVEATVAPSPAPSENTIIDNLGKNLSELDNDPDITKIELPKAPKNPKKPINLKWLWLLLGLLLVGGGIYYKFLPSSDEKPVVTPPPPKAIDTILESPSPVQPTSLIDTGCSPEDLRLYEAQLDERSNQLLGVGTWQSNKGRRLVFDSPAYGTFARQSITGAVKPMKGGIYVKIETLNPPHSEWRFIVEPDSVKGQWVLKLHDGPNAPFISPDSMEVFARVFTKKKRK